MLATKNMLDALSTEEKNQNHENHNNDHDLGAVLEFFNDNTTHQHKFRYSDGTEEVFSFNN